MNPLLFICGWILLQKKVCSAFIYELKAPSSHTVFGSDLEVSFKVPAGTPSMVVELFSMSNNSSLTYTNIPPNITQAVLTFGCGTIKFQGLFVFKMLDKPNGHVYAQSETVNATWPQFHLTIPTTHTALEDEVMLTFSVEGVSCFNELNENQFWFNIVYYNVNLSMEDEQTGQVVHSYNISSFVAVNNVPLTFNCELFDLGGEYKVDLRSSLDHGVPIVSSNLMRSSWSDGYSIVTARESIFPCKEIVIQYHHPKCTGNEDRIRVYQRYKVAEISPASPIKEVYIAEKRARSKSNGVIFECDLFHESALGYCFRYVSRSLRGTHEQASLCLPSTEQYLSAAVAGGWSAWSEWSPCRPLGSGCGGHGLRARHRQCNDPAPAHGGSFCEGRMRDEDNCSVPCPETSTTETTRSPFIDLTPAPECKCGCTLAAQSAGKIVSSMHCRGSTIWIVHGPQNHQIEMHFEVFTLDPESRQTWVKVRDGDSHMSNLLLHSFGGTLPKMVMSSSNTMLLEFMAPYDQDTTTFVKTPEGFIAYYKSIESNATAGLGVTPASGQHFWENAVTLVGILLCGFIIILTLVFVCRRRCKKKTKEKSKQTVHESLLINGELANSPSNSNASRRGSCNKSYSSPCGSIEHSSPLKISGKSPIFLVSNDGHKFEDAFGSANNVKSPIIGERTVCAQHSPDNDDIMMRENRRPPVEGRDSLTKKNFEDLRKEADDLKYHQQVNLPEKHSANLRVEIKPLPLRDIQRPDGQSPDSNQGDNDQKAVSPSSTNSLFSELHRDPLFGDTSSVHTPSMDITLDQDFEYDDYIPNLPGSYFTMDPHAYTLTWSQQAPWNNKAPSTRASSQNSMANNATSQL